MRGLADLLAFWLSLRQSSVQAALALDREKMDGRPMFVSKCVDKDKNPTSFKYPTKLDKNTLFVANIPFDTQQAALEELFSPVSRPSVKARCESDAILHTKPALAYPLRGF